MQKSNYKSKRSYSKVKSKGQNNKPCEAGKDFKAESKDGFQNPASKFNDPAWYGMDSALLRDSASVPFVYPMGAPVSTGIASNPTMTVPGVCAIELSPTLGYSDSPNSPINIASNSLYTYIRHANSGSRNYDAPNLMMYILASADVFSYINFLQRVYGVAMLYNQMNRYIPEALLKSMNVDANSIKSNLANFRYGINVLINKASSLAVPANIPLFRRKAFIYANIYKEGMSIKDQLYLFVPAGFFQYGDPNNLAFRPLVPGTLTYHTEISNDGKYEFTTSDHNVMKYDDLLDYGEQLLNGLFGSEDMGLMNGDILKAYGSEGILKLQEVPENYSIDFSFDIGVLEQMKNAYPLSLMYTYSVASTPSIINKRSTFKTTSATVKPYLPFREMTDDPVYGPYIQSLPCITTNEIASGNKWITTQAEVVTPDLVMENSRLIPAITESDGLPEGFSAVNAMTEVVVATHYYSFAGDGKTLVEHVTNDALVHYTNVAAVAPDTIANLISFRFHPFTYLSMTNTTTKETRIKLGTNIDNYTICTNDVIYRLNQTALMSLLNVPSVAKAY